MVLGQRPQVGGVGVELKGADAALGRVRVRDGNAQRRFVRGECFVAFVEALPGMHVEAHETDFPVLDDGIEQALDRFRFDVPDGGRQQRGVGVGDVVERAPEFASLGVVLAEALGDGDEQGAEQCQPGRLAEELPGERREGGSGHGRRWLEGALSKVRSEKS